MYEPVNPYARNEIILDAKIFVNYKVISTPVPWNVEDLYNNIKKKVEQNPLSFTVAITAKQQYIKCSTATINELVDMTVSIFDKKVPMKIFMLEKLPPASE